MNCLITRVETGVMNEVGTCKRDLMEIRITKHCAISCDSHAERKCFHGRKPEEGLTGSIASFTFAIPLLL